MESLFKGKRIDNGEWIEGSLVVYTMDDKGKITKDYRISNMITGVFPDTYQAGYEESVEPSSVSQYIGVPDSNGTKIFNSDVVSVKENGKEIYRFVVEYGVCGDTRSVAHTVGYMGYYFVGADEKTKKELNQGLRNDILYWLNDDYFCEVVGHLSANSDELEEEPKHIEESCKIGDTVYQIDAERVYESKIKNIIYDTDNIAFDKTAIGTSVFLSKAEAEKRLQRVDKCKGCCHYYDSCGYADSLTMLGEEKAFEKYCESCCCCDGFECNKEGGTGCDNYKKKPY